MRDPRVIASDISGPILFEGDRISIPGFYGSVNGGSLDASGGVTVDGLQVTGGEMTFQARGVAVEYPENVDSEIDALLTFVPAQGESPPMLRGDVRVLRGAYRATVSLPALVAFNRAPAPPAETSDYIDSMRLDIGVSTEEDLVVDNNYGRFEAGANLRLQGTVGRPGVTGRAELREGGEIFLLGGLYRLNASNISFTNPSAIEPDLNISMSTRSSGAETTVTLARHARPARDQRVVERSDANENLMSVLLGGNSLGRDETPGAVFGRAAGRDRPAHRPRHPARRARLRHRPHPPGSRAGRRGIEPGTRLTMSKRIRSNVEVILSQDLRQNGGLSAIISYRPIRNVELRAISRDNTDRGYSVRHEINFGGGAPVATAQRETSTCRRCTSRAPAPTKPRCAAACA